MQKQKESKINLLEAANKLLAKNGFLYDGSEKKKFSKGQLFFERKIIMPPMGNKMR